jgi:hypothetical protein
MSLAGMISSRGAGSRSRALIPPRHVFPATGVETAADMRIGEHRVPDGASRNVSRARVAAGGKSRECSERQLREIPTREIDSVEIDLTGHIFNLAKSQSLPTHASNRRAGRLKISRVASVAAGVSRLDLKLSAAMSKRSPFNSSGRGAPHPRQNLSHRCSPGAGNSHSIPGPEDYHKCNSAQQIRLLHRAPNRVRRHRVVVLVPAQIIRRAPVRRLA